MKLTTQQIATIIDNGTYPTYDWEYAIEMGTGLREEELKDAVSAARFLEQWRPETLWTAQEFYNLLYTHVGSRWDSAAQYGAQVAQEEYEDGKISAARLAEITASDDAAADYAETFKPGMHIFRDENGTVVIFADLFGTHDLQKEEIS